MIVYKVLNEAGCSCHGGNAQWSLPSHIPARWMPPVTNIRACERGYHLCEGELDLLKWLGPVIFTAEYRGEYQRSTDKIVVSEARLIGRCEHWNERTARLFAAACARDVLPLFEKVRPNDSRVRDCIVAVERFANGEVNRTFLDAARAAAWAAEGAAEGAAAQAAARKKLAARLAYLLQTGEIT